MRVGGVNSLELLQVAVLATCAIVAVWQAWELKSETTPRSTRLRSWARIVACAGGAIIISPMIAGFHGWTLKAFVITGIIFLLGYGLLIYSARASSASEGRDSGS